MFALRSDTGHVTHNCEGFTPGERPALGITPRSRHSEQGRSGFAGARLYEAGSRHFSLPAPASPFNLRMSMELEAVWKSWYPKWQ